MLDLVRGITLGSALVFLVIVSGAQVARATGQSTALIAGNHSPSIERFATSHPAPADRLLQMSISLNPSNRPALEALRAAQQDPASPDHHRWLKAGEFDRRFGPDPAVRAAIAQWLATAGFTVAPSKGNPWTVKFSGTVTQAEHGFGVAIVSPDEGQHFANLTDPSIPSQFAGSISYIDGLDNLRGSSELMHIAPGSPADSSSPQRAVELNGLRDSARATFTPSMMHLRCLTTGSTAPAAAVSG
jgi:subtilase family serine protease